MNDKDLSFLAPPGQLADWRLVLLVDAADGTGLLGALPGTAGHLAARLDLDPAAVTVVLEALAVFGVVTADADGGYTAGPAAPGPDAGAVLNHHARSLRQWATGITDQLRGTATAPTAVPASPERWLDSMATHARRVAPAAVDACLARAPEAASVLDLGGGHGEYALELARRGLRVTMQDRPVMIDIARSRGTLEAAGVELFAGDFFEVLAEGPFDLVFCAGVTNTFGAERNLALYDRVRSCLAPEGVLVIQSLLRDHHPTAVLFGVQMLSVGNGGDAHPEARYREWLARTGFGPVEAVDLDDGRRTILFAALNAQGGGDASPS